MSPITKDHFFEIFPWGTNHLSLGKPVNWFWQFELDLPVEFVWPHLVDTSRLNRLFKLPKMEFQEKDGVLYGKTNYFGLKTEWKENPWTWIFHKSAIDIREYDSSFLKVFRGIFYFEESPDKRKTILTIQFGLIINGFFSRFLVSFLEKPFQRTYRKALHALEKTIQKSPDKNAIVPILKNPPPELPTEIQEKIKSISLRLLEKKIHPEILNKLISYIQTEDELDLHRIRVIQLAEKWKINPNELLRTCLHATREGLLTLSWDVICPHCRGVRIEANTLGDVPKKGECEVCEIDFNNDTENSIEITFHVHPSIRNIPKILYCSAEASLKPHIKLQQFVQPGSQLNSNIPLEAGNYRMRIKGFEKSKTLAVSERNPSKDIRWESSDTSEEFYTSTNPLLILSNNTAKPLIFTIEEISWSKNILKPAALFNMQDFHDLFSSEYISSDLQLEIGEQTILFTDMVGSTKFYASQGDSRAFLEVKKHFEEIFRTVRENNGAVIKTIGDAVMASFAESTDAIKASISLQKLFFQDRKDTPIRLRVSVNSGKCIAVNLNSNIDYFGGTVNIAAKIQGLAGSGEVVFTEIFFQRHGVKDYLTANGFKPEPDESKIPGFVEKIQVYKIKVGD